MLPGSPPFLSHHLFEDPRLLMIALGITAVILLLLARRRESRRLLTAGIVALALTGGEFFLARLVVTIREQITERTTTLVHMADPIDLPSLQTMFTPQVQVTGPTDEVLYNRASLFERLKTEAQMGRVGKLTIDSIAADVRPNGEGLTLLKLTIAGNVMGYSQNLPSDWLLSWHCDSDGQWRVANVKCLRLPGISMTGPLPGM